MSVGEQFLCVGFANRREISVREPLSRRSTARGVIRSEPEPPRAAGAVLPR